MKAASTFDSHSVRKAVYDWFDNAADWRERKADEYPEDKRNAQAAKELRELADWAGNLEEETLLALHEAYEGNGSAVAIIDEEIRHIGFHAGYKTAADFVEHIIHKLNPHRQPA